MIKSKNIEELKLFTMNYFDEIDVNDKLLIENTIFLLDNLDYESISAGNGFVKVAFEHANKCLRVSICDKSITVFGDYGYDPYIDFSRNIDKNDGSCFKIKTHNKLIKRLSEYNLYKNKTKENNSDEKSDGIEFYTLNIPS